MCLCCLLVLDYTHLCRSIYLRGIPLGGLSTVGALGSGVRVVSMSNKMVCSACSSSLPQISQIFMVGSISWIINADGVGELIEPVQIDSTPITPTPATTDPISEPPPRSSSPTTHCPLPRYQRRRINNDDLIASIDQVSQKLVDCLSIT